MNQSELEANTGNRRQTRRDTAQDMIGFGFKSDLLKRGKTLRRQ